MSTGFDKIAKDSQLQDHWIRRLAAFIIDEIIISIFTIAVIAIIATPLIIMGIMGGFPWTLLSLLPFTLFLGVSSLLYFALSETYWESTFGKRIMNLKAARVDGQKLPPNLAFIRNLSKIYWLLVLIDTLVGLAMPGDPHQKLSDRYAGTTVLSTGASPLTSVEPVKATANLCVHCGKNLPENAIYCPHCGKQVH